MVDRLRVRVRGLVQGVGFRPFAHRLATQFRLSGFVRNDTEGVLIEVQGEQLSRFVTALRELPPPLSRVDAVDAVGCPAQLEEAGFVIAESLPDGPSQTVIGPDLAPCDDCLDEIYTPTARRYLYPFTNCTHCGPRYTITRALPYDRPQTTLRDFPLCAACRLEYSDPHDRRFHAQPMACPTCGPRLSHPLSEIVARLLAGQIVALKGLGGFHLICDATRESVVQRLRQRKHREAKPLALMVMNLESARLFADVSDEESALLSDPRRPIVLLRRKSAVNLAPSLATSLSTVGLMLPMSPLHDLLVFSALGSPSGLAWREQAWPLALVMTSGNLAEEPIVCDDEEARHKLAVIADLVVTHDRPIAARLDDSVVKQVAGRGLLIRRARGQVPEPIELPFDGPPLLGLGGDLKATLCLVRGREAFVSSHIGDLGSVEMARSYHQTLESLCQFLAVRPELVVADRHPDFVARRLVADLRLPLHEVQHHHAHLQAVLAEHGGRESAIGLVLDGFGLGDDGTAWGGELLLSEGSACRRIGHLRPLPQPGAETASREPWRLATAMLGSLGLPEEAIRRFGARWPVPSLLRLVDKPGLSPPTTSCGRYFQVASALLGLREVERYEGEAAMVLESQVRRPTVLASGFTIHPSGSCGEDVLDLAPLWRALLDCDAEDGAALFHGTLAAGLAELALRALRRHGKSELVLTGGCVVNRWLTESLISELQPHGITVLLPRRLPPGDGALSLGQVFVAALRLREC